jgi:hypothetical protein
MKFYPFLILFTATTLLAQSQAQNGQEGEFKGREERQLSGTCYRPDKNLLLACKPSEKH